MFWAHRSPLVVCLVVNNQFVPLRLAYIVPRVDASSSQRRNAVTYIHYVLWGPIYIYRQCLADNVCNALKILCK